MGYRYRDDIFVKRSIPTVCFAHTGIKVSVTYKEYILYPIDYTHNIDKQPELKLTKLYYHTCYCIVTVKRTNIQ